MWLRLTEKSRVRTPREHVVGPAWLPRLFLNHNKFSLMAFEMALLLELTCSFS